MRRFKVSDHVCDRQYVVSAPACPPTRPLARCTAFTKVWSNACEGRSVRETLDSVLVGANQGLTVWRPQAPTGYAILGDCITLGGTQPTFQVGRTGLIYRAPLLLSSEHWAHILWPHCRYMQLTSEPSCPPLMTRSQQLAAACAQMSAARRKSSVPACPLTCCLSIIQVIAVAINSGLVEFPTGYDLAWQKGNVSIWQPIAPPGYAAIGCLFGVGSEPPSPSTIVCVHQKVRGLLRTVLFSTMAMCSSVACKIADSQRV